VSGRDIVVIGASAGGLPGLETVARGLPRDLRASLFVVLHSCPELPSRVPELLSRAGPLPATHASDRERFRRGHIYIAPPDHHLLLRDGTMLVTLGPRENGFRPAVDPLFRTAAHEHGSRVVGIVLSGALDDGTRGLAEIKRAGGVAIAQHIDDAVIPGMPMSAIRNVKVDHVVPANEIAPLIVRFSTERPPRGGVDASKRGRHDVAEHGSHKLDNPHLGLSSPFTCPECGGALWQRRNGNLTDFYCHVGHSYTTEGLASGLNERVEGAMWTALRTLEESTFLQQRLAEETRARGLVALARERRARTNASCADAIRSVLTSDRERVRRRTRRKQRKEALSG
jgi:two-component system chemotaxis response regulator CheB